MPVVCTCEVCGAETRRSPSAVKPHMFCSHECFAEWKRTRTGSLAGGWHGGTMTDPKNGRVRVKLPGHASADKYGYAPRARVVAEQKLGRPLRLGEVVHHIDGNPANDDPANLHVFASEAEHQRHHGIQRGGLNGQQHSRNDG